jgi:hypothetical protein
MKKPQAKIVALLEFSENGYLESVCLFAENDRLQEILETAISRLIRPAHFGWLQRLFQR